jgi:hypothetical protein
MGAFRFAPVAAPEKGRMERAMVFHDANFGIEAGGLPRAKRERDPPAPILSCKRRRHFLAALKQTPKIHTSMESSSISPLSPSTALARHLHTTPLSWAAILGGLIGALAFQTLFMLLGAGLGFSLYHPITSDSPVEDLGAGGIIIQGVSAVFSLWFGGWIAGRFTPLASRASGGLHGFLVWCTATVAGVLIVSWGAGWILGDLSKVVGGGLSAAGKPAAAAVSAGADFAKEGAKQSSDLLASFTDQVVASQPADANKAKVISAKRDVGLAVGRLFNPLQKDKMTENKAALTRTLVEQAGLPQEDADRLVREWTDSYNRLSADLAEAKNAAEEKTRVAADKAAHVLAIFSLGAFVAFVLGAISAACGGRHGAAVAFKYDHKPSALL